MHPSTYYFIQILLSTMRMSSPLVLKTISFIIIIIAACSRTAGSFSPLPSVRRRNNMKSIAQRKVINVRTVTVSRWRQRHRDHLLSNKSSCMMTTTTMMMQPADLADDDLIALPFDAYITSSSPTSSTKTTEIEPNQQLFKMRLCVIRNQQYIYPLIRHEDDVETDLFLDPRFVNREITLDDMLQWCSDYCKSNNINNDDVHQYKYYGVGWYGQRPVPSLGGGPGYGAEADEVWSVDEDVLEEILNDYVDIPVIDVGMAHGEKARGGALF